MRRLSLGLPGRRRPWLPKIAIALSVAVLVIVLTQESILKLGVLQRLELATIDYRFQKRGPSALIADSSHVIIVEISEDSFKSLPEKFPWPRTYYAHLVRNLYAAGAKAVGIDLIFSGADTARGNDRDFEEAIRQTKFVVLAGKREQDNTIYTTTSSHEDYGNIFFGGDSCLGLVNIRPDADGVYRLYNPYFMTGPAEDEIAVPTFGFAVLNRYFGLPPFNTPIDGPEGFTFAGRLIPKYDPGSLLINYYGPNGTFRHIKFHDVIDDESFTTLDEQNTGEQINTFSDPDYGYLHDGTFKDKIVLVGVTVPEYKDLFPVPFARGEQKGDNLMYGVEIHANVIESVLRNQFMRVQSSRAEIAEVVLLVLFTFLLITSARGTNRRLQILVEAERLAVAAALILAVGFIAMMLFIRYHYVAAVVPPMMAIGAAYVTGTAYNLVAERKQRMMIKNMFSTYVNPSLVDQLVANPERLVLGGERKELTVLFSDIEGFTTISQNLPPEELVTILNEYLDVMSGIIFTNNGTLDKYEGDAVMAFWGAPLPQEDHALRACLSALQMQEALGEINRSWQAMNRPFLRIRIGINTGDMVVGNMGATGKFAYTVMGDSVNLASRLEGANKEYQTGIMVSRRTYELVKHAVIGRELDRITVKGRSEPVTTYELIASVEHGIDPEFQKFLTAYAEAMELSHACRWADARKQFASALRLRPDDYPARVHLARMERYESAPPEEGGDIVRMERK